MKKLISTITGVEYPFERLGEFADDGESLEVFVPDIDKAHIRQGRHIWERFAEFLPFDDMDPELSLGEGNTPLIPAGKRLREFTGCRSLLLKNETQNPTWSFKDRGSLTCMQMAREMGESVTATISTGNMGNSVAAYAAKANLRAIIFVPDFAPKEKIAAMAIHGATVMKVSAPDYSLMKSAVLELAGEFGLRIVSGNGPVRVEGYKLTAFEMWEQMEGKVPDFIAVPTSACGHIRGLFKGYRELMTAGLIEKLPKMIVVQAKNNSPIVTAIKEGKSEVVPFTNFHTVAEALTSGNPQGGDEIIDKAYKFGWLAEDVTEDEILESQRQFAMGGYFVESATATILGVVKKLVSAGKIKPEETVVLMLTGSGLKDMDVMKYHTCDVIESSVDRVRSDLSHIV
jgi:threonine synthase